ncbi:transcriptional regulator [Mariniflexile ostreae]|uniref:Transcriptional regulator n=1 Tax=Mariniflexile ostreae TaxID=1520892 RepID=A0ABV5F8R0_9FLAO
MKFKFLNFFLILCLLLNTHILIAQYTPYFQNYSLSEYHAGNQNWGVSKSENGKLYVANNNGLLEFDGLNWELKALPNKTIIRSVLAHNDKIYTGSYEEFGFWEDNKKGVLEYTSLSDKLQGNDFLNEEFWEIVAYKDMVVFRSFLNIYIVKGGDIIKIKPKSTVISCDIVNGQLFVSTLRNGIFTLDNTRLINVIEDELLKESKVVSISKIKKGLLITTAIKGCFIYDGTSLFPWNSNINSLIKQHQLNSHTTLEDGTMVFGTIQNGVYYTDADGRIRFHINKENGLANNTVLSQHLALNNELWLGLDNGLTSIDLNGAHSFYNDISGSLGAVYDVISFQGTIYIASNTGLYFLDQESRLHFISGSQGQVWDLKEINGQLFCGHNNGTYLVENKTMQLISNFTGGWVLKKVPEKNKIYMQGTYAGIVKFEENAGKWNVTHMQKTTAPIRYLEFEDQYHAWAAHAYRGVYRMKFNKDYDSIIEMKNYKHKGLESNFNVRVYKIKNDICFKTNNGWHKYEPLLDSIVAYPFLNKKFGKDAYIISEADINVLGVKGDETISFNTFTSSNHDFFLPIKYFKNRLIVGYENISKISDSVFALSLNDGFALLNKSGKAVKDSLFPVSIESVGINGALIDLEGVDAIDLPYSDNIAITISSPKSKDAFFEYAIFQQTPKVWNKMERATLKLSNLNNGDYTISFRVANGFGDRSVAKDIKIKVLPPWYKGVKGLFLFIAVLILVSLVAFYFHKRKIEKEQKALQEKLAAKQEALLKEHAVENEKRMVQLKNQSLKSEVKLKSKQLANTAMSLVKKNESVLEIKNELVKSKAEFKNTFVYKKLLRKIDNSIGHEDEWQLFEYNFNQVHEEFFNQLKSKFPKLTHKDLKICAYIKMNLLTKEIAPLMNVSIRGLETHRYRLKSKLNLGNDISVSDFLRDFK